MDTIGNHKFFHPSFGGLYKTDYLSPNFKRDLISRIESKRFIPGAPPERNQYEVAESTHTSLHFRSTNFMTSLNIGLNEVWLRIDPDRHEVEYMVLYWRWALYCIGIGLAMAVVFVAGEFLLPEGWYPPEHLRYTVFWPSVWFFTLLWPWLLIGWHKRPARRFLTRIFDEINESGADRERRPAEPEGFAERQPI